jgi:hypothetical protein
MVERRVVMKIPGKYSCMSAALFFCLLAAFCGSVVAIRPGAVADGNKGTPEIRGHHTN